MWQIENAPVNLGTDLVSGHANVAQLMVGQVAQCVSFVCYLFCEFNFCEQRPGSANECGEEPAGQMFLFMLLLV